MIEVKICDTYQIAGRGTVFVVKQEDNPTPLLELMGEKISVDGTEYKVWGLERMGIFPPRIAGLLVRKL